MRDDREVTSARAHRIVLCLKDKVLLHAVYCDECTGLFMCEQHHFLVRALKRWKQREVACKLEEVES